MALSNNVNLLDQVMKAKVPGMAGKEANTLEAMQVVKQQPQATAQQIGAGLASAQGKENIKQLQSVVQEKAAGMETAQAKEVMAAREQASQMDLAYKRLAEKNQQRLFDLDKSAAYQINQANRQFIVDEAGRKYLNDRMLDQYVVNKAKSEEEIKNYNSQMQLAFQRKAQLMETYAQKLMQALEQGFISEKQVLDQASRKQIVEMVANYRKEAERAKAKAAMRGQIGNLLVTAGAVVAATTAPTGVGLAIGGGMMAAGTAVIATGG